MPIRGFSVRMTIRRQTEAEGLFDQGRDSNGIIQMRTALLVAERWRRGQGKTREIALIEPGQHTKPIRVRLAWKEWRFRDAAYNFSLFWWYLGREESVCGGFELASDILQPWEVG